MAKQTNVVALPRRTAFVPVPAGSFRGKALPDKDKQKPRSPDRSNMKDAAPQDRDTGAALRSIYQETIDEQIPDEFLDLLGKLD